MCTIHRLQYNMAYIVGHMLRALDPILSVGNLHVLKYRKQLILDGNFIMYKNCG